MHVLITYPCKCYQQDLYSSLLHIHSNLVFYILLYNYCILVL